MANTGNTTTLAFSAWSSYAPAIETIDPPEFSVEDIDTSHLGTTNYKTRKAADLQDIGDMTLSCQFDGEIDDLTVGESGTITLTFPVLSGDSSGPTLAGTGYVKSFKPEEISNDSKLMATVVLAFDGDSSEPTWTAGS